MNAGRRVLAGLSLAGAFARDLVASSFDVARIVLAPRPTNQPAIVALPVDASTRWGVALFAYLVSLTPGSTCLHVSDDLRTLYVHFLDAPDIGARVTGMKALYERRIRQLEGEELSR